MFPRLVRSQRKCCPGCAYKHSCNAGNQGDTVTGRPCKACYGKDSGTKNKESAHCRKENTKPESCISLLKCLLQGTAYEFIAMAQRAHKQISRLSHIST